MNSDKKKLINKRQAWHIPAIIFGGLEFSIPVIIVGGILATHFSIFKILCILTIGLVIIQWLGNAVIGYIGAKTGLNASSLASKSFGKKQSKFIVSTTLLIISLGWWAIQTALTTDALLSLLGITKKTHLSIYSLAVIFVGFLFSLPSVIGLSSIKWVDYIAIPAGVILVLTAIYLSFQNTGFQKIIYWKPEANMTFLSGVNLVISINVAQWLFVPDYTKYAKPTWRDNILIPLGIVAIGFPLFLVGAIMNIGIGSSDIVYIMKNLGFPAWGFVVLWMATWTSQMVNNFTGGLALSNIFSTSSERARKKFTIVFSLLGMLLAIIGIMHYFTNFLYLLALLVPAITGVVITHYFKTVKGNIRNCEHWNINASIALIAGVFVGYFTQYVFSFGVPALQSLVASALSYFLFIRKSN
ncbi:MAG: cytosine permease [Tenacibaculum sp.]